MSNIIGYLIKEALMRPGYKGDEPQPSEEGFAGILQEAKKRRKPGYVSVNPRQQGTSGSSSAEAMGQNDILGIFNKTKYRT